jgi:putative FmdB family regulatory protein
MPLREYICQECGNTWEELIMNDQDEEDLYCLECGSNQLERQMSSFAINHGASQHQNEQPAAESGHKCHNCSNHEECSSTPGEKKEGLYVAIDVNNGLMHVGKATATVKKLKQKPTFHSGNNTLN